jgi:membrane protein required for colicin V production
MTGFDFGVLAIVALSTLFAFFRGVVRELIALVSWIAGLALALAFEGPLAAMLPGFDATPAARHVIAFALIFVAVLVAGALVAYVLAKFVRAAGLAFVDRFLGSVFGVARGMIIVLFAVLVAGLTTLPRHEWWQNAALGPPLVEAALALRPWLPAAWAERLDYSPAGRKPARQEKAATWKQDGEFERCVES